MSVQNTEVWGEVKKEPGNIERWSTRQRLREAACASIQRTVRGCGGYFILKIDSDKMIKMSFTIKTCVVCGEEFELKPDKPGFANRCPECSDPERNPEKGSGKDKKHLSAEERKAEAEANAERRKAIRDLLYKKDR